MDVTGTPVRMDGSEDPIQFGQAPFPGIYIGQDQVSGELNSCTLGPLIRGDRGQLGFLTAGHCDDNPGAEVSIFTQADAHRTEVIGVLTQATNVDAAGIDHAALWPTVTPADNADRIAGFKVAGHLTAAEVIAEIPEGAPVCVNGAFAGVVCAPLVQAAETITFDEVTGRGDSGAPVFVVDRDDQRAWVIGLLEGAVESGVDSAVYIQPALDRIGAELVTAAE